MSALIDPPSPFDPLEEWERFAAEIRELAKSDEDAARELRNAERHIAELKKRQD